MKTLRVVLLTILVSCFLQTDTSAQQEKQPNQTPTGLSLEVISWKGEQPIYQVVPNNSWYGRFRQIPSSKAVENSLPVQAVNIAARMEGDSVRVVVSLHLGKKFFEKQDQVGSYLLRENERVTVSELATYGLEPFEIGVVRVDPKSAPLPAASSNARSVKVLNIQPVDSTFPAFKLTLLNTSGKNISALFVETFVDGKRRTSSMPHNQDGETLIAAGGTYEFKRQLNNVASPAPAGYTPETPPNQMVVIQTAVFEDGTYEGDAPSAANYRGFALGRRTQLTSLLTLYQRALDFTESDAKTVLDRLREEVRTLGIAPEQPDLEKLLSDFPTFSESDKALVKSAIEVVMFDLGKEALKGIDGFEKKQGATIDKEAMRGWMKSNIDKCRKWRDNLKNL